MLRLVIHSLGLVAASTAVFSSGASATVARDGAIDPGTRINGMHVVQGLAREADVSLFGTLCNPVVLTPGRRVRTCLSVPAVKRLFVGYGVFAPEKQIDAAWNKRSWAMWIDNRAVDLTAFGHGDRWLYNYRPAGGRNVVLREWFIVLSGARGHHSIRYRTRVPEGVFDTTWKFNVASR